MDIAANLAEHSYFAQINLLLLFFIDFIFIYLDLNEKHLIFYNVIVKI